MRAELHHGLGYESLLLNLYVIAVELYIALVDSLLRLCTTFLYIKLLRMNYKVSVGSGHAAGQKRESVLLEGKIKDNSMFHRHASAC
jgi:hypothetical protein